MKIAVVALATLACIATCGVAQAHIPMHHAKHHVVCRSVSERSKVWPGMMTDSSMQGAARSDSWRIPQLESTSSGE
jgi:hypothetical protein